MNQCNEKVQKIVGDQNFHWNIQHCGQVSNVKKKISKRGEKERGTS